MRKIASASVAVAALLGTSPVGAVTFDSSDGAYEFKITNDLTQNLYVDFFQFYENDYTKSITVTGDASSFDETGDIGVVGSLSSAAFSFYSPNLIQLGDVPFLATTSNSTTTSSINFRFWSGVKYNPNVIYEEGQYINILPYNGFTITANTAVQNNAEGGGYTVGLGGGGQKPTQDNIVIVVSSAASSDWTAGSAVPEPATWGTMLIGFAGLCVARLRTRDGNRRSAPPEGALS
jgi:hypothetical protein